MASFEIPGTPNQPEANPDFYQDVFKWTLTPEEIEAGHNVIKVDSIDDTINKALLHKDCAKLGEKLDLGYEFIQLLRCPDGNILILRELKHN